MANRWRQQKAAKGVSGGSTALHLASMIVCLTTSCQCHRGLNVLLTSRPLADALPLRICISNASACAKLLSTPHGAAGSSVKKRLQERRIVWVMRVETLLVMAYLGAVVMM